MLNDTPDQNDAIEPVHSNPSAFDIAVLEHLAALSPIDYDRCRQAEADRLGIRVCALDDEVERIRLTHINQELLPPEPDPWPEAVNGADILSEVAATLRRYVVLTDHQATAISLWIAHAHAHDAATISPRLSIASPTKRCGKTTLLSVIQTLVPRALSTSKSVGSEGTGSTARRSPVPDAAYLSPPAERAAPR